MRSRRWQLLAWIFLFGCATLAAWHFQFRFDEMNRRGNDGNSNAASVDFFALMIAEAIGGRWWLRPAYIFSGAAVGFAVGYIAIGFVVGTARLLALDRTVNNVREKYDPRRQADWLDASEK